VLVLGLQGAGFRRVEAIVLALVLTIGVCFAVELVMVHPNWFGVSMGFVPSLEKLKQGDALYLAIGIVGATVMPHNLYLHSSIVQTRLVAPTPEARHDAIRYGTFDVILSLSLALLINAAILVLAASAFHGTNANVAEIEDAYRLLDPMVGSSFAAVLFGIALLASGQSSTFTGTIAGQVVMEGFLKLKIPCWQRRLLTRSLALLPAFAGIWYYGDGGVGKLLVLSQVVLSFQLPFAIWPLLRFTGDIRLMGEYANSRWVSVCAWAVFAVIASANAWLVASIFT
jgi:manganese transport protein